MRSAIACAMATGVLVSALPAITSVGQVMLASRSSQSTPATACALAR